MLAAGRGSIVTIGSMSGVIVNKPQGQANYNASKAARASPDEVARGGMGARGIRVNAVAPTYINTPLTALASQTRRCSTPGSTARRWRRMGEPDEVAAVVLFLASDAASLMTGSIVLADGGYTCW